MFVTKEASGLDTGNELLAMVKEAAECEQWSCIGSPKESIQVWGSA
jgi:hypothetical protein